MKKLLLSLTTILLLALTVITMVNGLSIGKLKVLGIKELSKENEELDEVILQATKMTSTDYQKKLNELDNVQNQLESKKKKYDDMVNISTESEVQAANQSYTYDYEFLGVRIGNHAKTEGVSIDMALTRNASGLDDIYNIKITANGTYVGIEEFITDIEDDDRLGFKIEDFKMVATSDTNVLQATFVCKNIKVNGLTANQSVTSKDLDSENNKSTDDTE